MYARDISRKIRASLQVRMEEGAFIGNFAPYGYQKSAENKHLLIPDPLTAPIVKRIFDSVAAGGLPAQIAGELNGEQILPPSLYRCQNNQKLNPKDYTACGLWTANTIIKLLHNPVYLGHMIQGKSKKLSFKSSLTLPVPPSERISVRKTHTPLISEKTFRACEAQLHQRTCRKHS